VAIEMQVRFSQSWAKDKYEKTLRDAINFVKGSRGCKDLLVKFAVLPTPVPSSSAGCSGNYRILFIHGFYPNETISPTIRSIITLKLRPNIKCNPTIQPEGKDQIELSEVRLEQEILRTFAHEFKHYLDVGKLRDKINYRHWEVRAKKFAEEKITEWKNKGNVQ
jgi:hypothetical protein